MTLPLAAFSVSAALGETAQAAQDGLLRSARAGGNPDRLRQTAESFESMFLEQMFDRVFSAGGDEGLFAEAGPGAEVYRSMLVKEYAGLVAKSGGVGLSDQIHAELLRLQEGSQNVG